MKAVKLKVGAFSLLLSTATQAYEIPLEGTVGQELCYSYAMIGFDSVINSRLGVPAEHALDLSRNPATRNYETSTYNTGMLKTILGAYLWDNTPHSYAIKVFFDCATTTDQQLKRATVDYN